MKYSIVEYDEQGRATRINVLFQVRAEAELSASMLRKFHAGCRYEVDQERDDASTFRNSTEIVQYERSNL
jgi:hypothetical protein